MAKITFVTSESLVEGRPSYLSDKSTNDTMGKILFPSAKYGMLSYIKENFGKISEREMARRLSVGKTSVNRWCRELGFNIQKNTSDEKFFRNWNPGMAYILGYIFADGNINWNLKKSYRAMTITAAEKDKGHLENIRSRLKSTKGLLYSGDTKSYRLIINSKVMCKDLMALGLTPHKSLTVRFPKVPERFLNHFIRGVIDGDGNVRYVNRKRSPYFEITISSGSKAFLKSMAKKIAQVGILGKVRENNNGVFILQYSCRRGLNLANWIYQKENLHMDRKFQQYATALRAGEANKL